MSVARARLLEPLYKIDVPLTHAAVVVGGGVAGMTAANALGDMGYEVHLVERSAKLGGLALELDDDHQGRRPGRARRAARAAAHRQPERAGSTSRPSSPTSRASSATSRASSREKDGKRTRRRPRRRRRGHRRRARTGPSSTAWAAARRSSPGSTWSACWPTTTRPWRTPGPSASSSAPARSTRTTPTARAPAASRASRTPSGSRSRIPSRPVYVWFKEIRTFGLLEEYYTKARELGVVFTRYDNDTPPAGERQRRRWRSAYRDPYLGREIDVPLDLLVLATPTVPTEGNERAQQAAQGAAHGRGLLPRGARQAAPRGLRQRGHLPLRRGPLPQEHRRDHQPGVRRRRTRRRHPRQAGPQGRRRGGRGRPGQVRRLPHLRARLPLRGAASSTSRPRRPTSRRPPARAAACASASAR